MAIAYVDINMNTYVDLSAEVGAAELWASDDMPFDSMKSIGYQTDKGRRRVPYQMDSCSVDAISSLALATNCYMGPGQSGSPVFFPETGGEVPGVRWLSPARP